MERAELERKNKETLDNILRVARETEEIGAATCGELHAQGEQLDRLHDKEHQVAYNIKQSERIVRGMSGFLGKVKNWFSKKLKRQHPAPLELLHPAQGATPTQRAAALPVALHSEEDKQLDALCDSTRAIKSMAEQIGQTLDAHNKKLVQIDEANDENTQDLRRLHYNTKKLL